MRKVQDGNESPFLSFSLLEQSLLAVESLKSRCKWRKEKRQVVKREVIWEWRSGESWPLVKGKMVCYFAGAWVWTCLFSAPPAKGKPFNKAGALVFSFFFFHFGGLCGNTEWGIGSFSRLTWTCKYNKKQWRIALFACKFKPSTWEGGLIFSIFFFFREQPCESSFWLVCVAVGTSLDRGACFFFFRFAVSSILAILYFYIGLWSQNRSNHAWYMNKAAKGRQKLQHPVFPPSLLRQYWLGQHLFTYPDRTGWGAFRCVWP